MSRRTLFIRVLSVLIIITAIASVIAYFVLKPDRPWLAFYIACCGGVFIVNFIISLILVIKNFKK